MSDEQQQLRKYKAALHVLNATSPPADSLQLAKQQLQGLKDAEPAHCFSMCAALVNSADAGSSASLLAEILATLCRNRAVDPEPSWPHSLLGVLATAADNGRSQPVMSALAGASCALVVRLRSLRADELVSGVCHGLGLASMQTSAPRTAAALNLLALVPQEINLTSASMTAEKATKATEATAEAAEEDIDALRLDALREELRASAAQPVMELCLGTMASLARAGSAHVASELLGASLHCLTAWVQAELLSWPALFPAVQGAMHAASSSLAAAGAEPHLPDARAARLSDLRHACAFLSAAAAVCPELEMEAQLASVLGAQFAELVDQLLGWALDESAPAALCAELNDAISHFGALWACNSPFGLTIARHLVDDLEALPPEPLPPIPPPPPRGAMPMSIQIAPKLARFVGCFSAVVGGLGWRFVSAPDHAVLVGRCLGCLAVRVPAALEAMQAPSTSASDFVAFADAAVMRLAATLRAKMAPHHSLAARVLIAPLHAKPPGARTPATLHALKQHLRLLTLQGNAIPANAAHELLASDSPLPALWLHPEREVTSALIATHRALLCGAHTSSAAAAVLLQGLLAELRAMVALLPSEPAKGAGAASKATGDRDAAPQPLSTAPTGVDTRSGSERAASEEPAGRSQPEMLRVMQGQLSLMAAVLADTSHCSHLLSVASTLIRQLHPLKVAAVRQRPTLSLAVTVALLGVSFNRTAVLAPPPGTGKALDASLGTLAAQLRLLITNLLSDISNSESAAHGLAGASPLAQLAALKATTVAITALSEHTSAAAAYAASNMLAAVPASDDDAAVQGGVQGRLGGEPVGDAETIFAVWLGHELIGGPMAVDAGGAGGSNRAGALLQHVLELAHDPSASLRLAALEAMSALLCSTAITRLGRADLARAFGVSAAALGGTDPSCRDAARALLASAAPAALIALSPHARVGHKGDVLNELTATTTTAVAAAAAVAATTATGTGAAQAPAMAGTTALTPNTESASSTDSAWWRRRLLTSPPPQGYGPLQLQRTLKLLAGRARLANDAVAHARLLVACGIAHPPQLHRLISVEPQLGAWWSVMEAARTLVYHRLRSPFGGPKETFEGLERMLTGALPTDAKSGSAGGGGGSGGMTSGGYDSGSRERLRLILHSFEQLERQIHNACDGSLALPLPPKPARLFFLNNRRVCLSWLSGLRSKLLSAALVTRQPASVVRHAQLRLVDLVAGAARMTVRVSTPHGTRLDVAEGQLRGVQGVLRDAEWTLCVLSEALLELGGKQVRHRATAAAAATPSRCPNTPRALPPRAWQPVSSLAH